MSKKTLGQWARLSTGIHRDPSFLRCSKDARYLFLSGIAVAKELNDDGRIDLQVLAMYQFGVMEMHEVELTAAELVDKGLWSHEGGLSYTVRSFLKWNESTEEQHDAKERKRLGALKTNHKRGLHAEAVVDCPFCNGAEDVSPGQNDEGAIAPATPGASGALSERRQETGDRRQETGDVDIPEPLPEPESEAAEQSNQKGSTTHEPEPEYPPEVLSLCRHLADRIEQHRDGENRPKISTRWLKDMDLLLRRGPLGNDKAEIHSPNKVANSIDAVFDGLAEPNNNGFCWANQIRCPNALRKHWAQLADAHRAKRANDTQHGPTADMSLDDQEELSTAIAELAAGADL